MHMNVNKILKATVEGKIFSEVIQLCFFLINMKKMVYTLMYENKTDGAQSSFSIYLQYL